MSRHGPPPTPTKLKLLRGNPGRRPINKTEPDPGGLPVRPVGMNAKARAVWNRVMRDYSATGVLTTVDADVLRIYCEAVVRYEQAARLLGETTPLVRGRRGNELVKHPLHQIVRDNADMVRAFGRELGFTPAARSALTPSNKPPTDALSAWEAEG